MIDLLNTFLKAHTIRSNPFLPCNIDGKRRLISTAITFADLAKQLTFVVEGLLTVTCLQVFSATVTDWLPA